MQQSTTLRYTDALVRTAVFAFWRRTVGLGFPVVVALLAAYLAFQFWNGDRGWIVGAGAALCVLGLVMAGMVYLVHLRASMAKFRALGDTSSTLIIDQAGITMSSTLGSSVVPWSGIAEVWQFPAFWLLLFSKSQFVTLPLEHLPEAMRTTILERVAAAGGKVSR